MSVRYIDVLSTPQRFQRSGVSFREISYQVLEEMRNVNTLVFDEDETEVVPFFMDDMTMLDENIEQTRQCYQGLEALKKDIECTKDRTAQDSSIDDELRREKLHKYDEELSRVETGIMDAKFNMELFVYIQALEAEKQKSNALVKRLRDENAWLVEELATSQKKCQKLDLEIIDLKQDLENFKYLHSLEKFDESKEDYDSGRGTDIFEYRPLSHTRTMQELGFDPEEEDTTSNNLNVHSPTNSLTTRSSKNDLLGLSSVTSASISALDDAPTDLKNLYSLINQLIAQGNFDPAISATKKYMERVKKERGEKSADYATVLYLFAIIYKEQKKFKEAIVFLKNALQIREQVFGAESAIVACTLSTIGVLFGKMGRFADSETYASRSVELRKSIQGADHPEVAKFLITLGTAQIGLKKYAEAENSFQQALDIYEKRGGPMDQNSLKTKTQLCQALIKQGRIQEAEVKYREMILAAHQKKFGAPTTSILDVAEDREINKRKDPSVDDEHVKKCVLVMKEVPGVLPALKQMANIFRREKKFDAASLLEDVAHRSSKEIKNNYQVASMDTSTISDSSNGQ
ncbi:unnamed protein product [Bursaphelenchus xylophilus]|uniref:Kinesin light chain n=1 Tax=Bursaphelenchus xylophilus TaxID=6326 RepID=A0A1I7RP49_BURXY|nr:unnamed protein product [Bursaphelenchus xylophilus]CAG9124553.1 unnamed protein product [Bursaphelenchus xylophilus]